MSELPKHYIGPSIAAYRALGVTYLILSIYGLSAILGGILTIFVAYGPVYGTLWPILVFVGGIGAQVGLARTRNTSKTGLEIWTTSALIILLLFYALGILLRNIIPDHDPNTDLSKGSYAFLPLALAVAPYFRLIDIAPPIDLKRLFRRQRGRK